MTFSFFADHHFFGDDPKGYHAVNIALHALAALFVFLLLSEFGLSPVSAFAGGLLFAAHPLQTEPVILASNREELLCGLFYFLSFWLYVRGGRTARAGSVAAFLLALFSKEMAASLPLALIAFDVYTAAPGEPVARVIRRKLFTYLPYVAGVAALITLRYTVYSNPEGAAGWIGGSPYSTLLTMSYVFFKYLKLLLIPIRQCADYVIPALHGLGNITAAISLCGLAAFVAAAIYLRGRTRFAGFALAFFFLSLLPVSNIIPFGAAMADRYMYIPSFALCLAAASLLDRPKFGVYKFAAAILVIAALAFQTGKRTEAWHGDISLWSDTTACAPESARAYINLGNAFLRDDQPVKAIANFKKAPSRTGVYEPDKYYYNLGLAYEKTGSADLARRAFEAAAGANPKFPEPLYHLAIIAARKGDADTGLSYLETAVIQAPDRADTHYVAANFILQHFNDEEHLSLAVLHLKNSLKADPTSASASGLLGSAYMRLNMFGEAEKALLTSIRNDKYMWPSYSLLSELYRTTGRPDKVAEIEVAYAAARRTFAGVK